MGIKELFMERMVFSLEVFPPRTEKGMEKLCGQDGVLDHLYDLKPDYISCTYGAGGTNVGRNMDVLMKVKRDGRTIPSTNFTCIGNTKEDIRAKLQEYLDRGINHMTALRGDLPVGWEGTRGDLHYATELVKFIRREFGDAFTISVAGSPEGHMSCRSPEADIGFLKQKQDNGADFIITQLCWDLEQFKYWMDAIRTAGVTMPVSVGVMPVTDAAATINIALSRNGCVLPRELSKMISRHWIFPNVFNPGEDEETVAAKKAAFREEGMAYTIRLIDEYRAMGVEGIHMYALNQYGPVTEIVKESGIVDLI